MRCVTGWMVFDEQGLPETFKMLEGIRSPIVFKTKQEAQKHAKENYQLNKVTINIHKHDYNMNVTPTKKQPIKTPEYIRK